MKKFYKISQGIIMAIIILALLAGNIAAYLFNDAISTFLGGYNIDVSNIDFTKSEEICEQIEGEGLVLLKNATLSDGKKSLPISEEVTKVNVFGWSSIAPAYSGGGSGDSGSVDKAVSFYQALTEAGIEYNADLQKMYEDYKKGRDDDNYWSKQYPYLNLIEPETEYITGHIDMNAVKAYSDTAIVFLSRLGGEHQDLPKRQVKWDGQETDEERTYLDITTQEEDLLQLIQDTGFKNVIVVVNSINTMNLSFVESDVVDSVISVGAIGQYGARAIAKAIKGEINPSGKTVDTYAYDFSTSSTYANSPDGHKTNTVEAGVKTYSNDKDQHYIDYQEGIYLGYKWYETADAEGFWDSNFAKDKWNIENGYEDVVQYPFGYGLSYTGFSWEVVDVSPRDGATINEKTKISVTVRVENVGEKAGADVVQLYYGTDYNEGGIEKAAKNLCAFQKTVELEPAGGENSVTEFTLTFDAIDMASYDYNDANGNGHEGYELEEGEYRIYVSKNAHEVADLSGKEQSGVITYKVKKDIEITEIDDATVQNQFTGDMALDNGISSDGSNTEQNISYMSRADFEGTFPVGTDEQRTMNFTYATDWNSFADTDETFEQGVKGDLKLYVDGKPNMDLIKELGEDYNSSKWDDLLNQMTEDELLDLFMLGGYQTAEIKSIGKPELLDLDGPQGLNGSVMTNVATNLTFFPSETVMAQTWNEKLAYTYGLTVAYEAEAGVSGWYAPACNLHRSPFGGRNYEYYSEDAFLSGKMAAQTVKGATNNGLYCYLKHLAVNETANNGSGASIGMFTWVTEQALREVYFKSFEIAVKEGQANAIMGAYNNIGATWAGGSYALLQVVLTEEWGFNGAVITDAWTPANTHYDFDLGLRSGTDMVLNSSNTTMAYNKLKDQDSTTALSCLRKSAHDMLYTLCNTIYRQYEYAQSVNDGKNVDMEMFATKTGNQSSASGNWWIATLIALDVVVVGLVGVWGYFIFIRKNKEGRNHEGESK